MISALENVTEIDLPRIWKLCNPEEAFSNLIYMSCFSLLENPLNMKVKTLKTKLLKTIIGLHRMSDLPCSSITNLIMKHEHLTNPIVDLVSSIAQEIPKSPFIVDLFKEIGSNDVSLDANGSKLLSGFIEEISGKIPSVVLDNLPLVVCHLNDELYQMRNAVITAISRILKVVKDDTKKRDELLEIMLERIKDVTGFTRSKTIQAWSYLSENGLIPLRILPEVVTEIVDRIQDKGAYVRKSAVQFLVTMLEYSPYGDSLQKTHFIQKLEDEKKKLESGVELSTTEKQNITKMVGYYSESLLFIDQIHKVVPIACRLLDSKTSSDVLECIHFFTIAYQFGIEVAPVGIKSMLKLIHSPEQSVKQGIIESFKKMFLSNPLKSPDECIEVSKSIIDLALSCSLSELTFLETIIGELMKKNEIPNLIILALWELFSKEDIGSMILLSMVANGNPDILKEKLKVLTNSLEKINPLTIRYTCYVLEKMKLKEKLDSKNSLFIILNDLILGTSLSLNDWIPFTEKAINIIFNMAKNPEEIIHNIVKKLAEKTRMTKNLTTEESTNVSVSSEDLTKLLFSIGHASLKELVFIEEKYKEKRSKKKPQEKNKEAIEEELGIDSITQNENEMDEWLENQEKGLVSSTSVYGSFLPLIIKISKNQDYKDSMIRRSAILALCKMMTIHNSVCEQNIQLLFSLLVSCSSSIRNNIIVSIGDLACRFPNTIEPWISKLYQCLSDEDSSIRKKTLMVLTHLILNDMIKIKTNISEMTKCIYDKDTSIANLTKSFFNELSKKGENPIYNILPDVISKLSADSSEEIFRDILRFLLSYINKDKQIDQLVDKLCARFKVSSLDKEWRNISYCISTLNHTDKSIKKLCQSIKLYQHTLQDQDVYENFIGIKKKYLKGDLKGVLEEWESEIEKIRGNDVQKPEGEKKEGEEKPKEKPKTRGRRKKKTEDEEQEKEITEKPKRGRKKKLDGEKKTRKGKRKQKEEEKEDQDDEIEEIEEIEEEKEEKKEKGKKGTKTQMKTRGRTKRKKVEEEKEEKVEEEEKEEKEDEE